MQTLPITIEDATFAELAAASRADGLTPAEFIRHAAEAELRRRKVGDPAISPSSAESVDAQEKTKPPLRDLTRPPTDAEVAERRKHQPTTLLPPHDSGGLLVPHDVKVTDILIMIEAEDFK